MTNLLGVRKLTASVRFILRL